jgi:hypothetical protein
LARAKTRRRAVLVAERFVEGLASPRELDQTWRKAYESIRDQSEIRMKNAVRAAAWCAETEVDAISGSFGSMGSHLRSGWAGAG